MAAKKTVKKAATKAAKKTTRKAGNKTATKTATKKASNSSARNAKEDAAEQKAGTQEITVVDNAAKRSRKKPVIHTTFARERVLTEASDSARELNNKGAFGTLLEDGKVQLSLTEALYLLEKNKIIIVDGNNRPLDFEKFVRKASKVEPNFWIRYAVYKDLRDRGYVVKTALKFGADFRVYDRGIKPGQDHARWIVYPVHEGERYTWFDFAAKNRVAHSTKKRLLMGVVDDENDVTYWEIKWVRP
ncbi:MAG: tRNA-intron lyase [Candidatus Woesearchaeota archaeon]